MFLPVVFIVVNDQKYSEMCNWRGTVTALSFRGFSGRQKYDFEKKYAQVKKAVLKIQSVV